LNTLELADPNLLTALSKTLAGVGIKYTPS
jgi:hypothetical protein